VSPPTRYGAEDASTIISPAALPPQQVAAFSITVVDGPDRGLTVKLDGDSSSRTYVGKSPVCRVRLSDPLVSRRHATFDVTGNVVRLVDLGSTNGTTVNGLRVNDVLLRGGELVQVGDTRMQVERLAPLTVAASVASSFGRTLGAAPEMRRLYPLCERLAGSDVPVLIEGETGTGKEVLAESLHEKSARAGKPFVVFDCTAVPPDLMEAALFGHERGSFTGAISGQKGLFELADGGTLFIDEIGELSTSLQPKLLRALDRSEVRRIGATEWNRVDVRLMAATRRDLEKEIQAGRFRDDLFYRLAVARIELPPLRQRQGDVALLAEAFWNQLGPHAGAIPHELVLRFESYSWPGNVRELRNAVAKRLALGDLEMEVRQVAGAAGPSGRSGPASKAMLGDDVIARVLELDLPLSQARDMVIEDFERRYLQKMMTTHEGDATRAAAAAGVARRYFQLLRSRRGA
jgi:two-component system, NtrC family, response regulator HydG